MKRHWVPDRFSYRPGRAERGPAHAGWNKPDLSAHAVSWPVSGSIPSLASRLPSAWSLVAAIALLQEKHVIGGVLVHFRSTDRWTGDPMNTKYPESEYEVCGRHRSGTVLEK